jgi:hypothetical protein
MLTTHFDSPRLRRLPPKAAYILTPMILSFLMSGIVASIATLRAVGLSPDVMTKILHAWMLSYPVAFPSAMIVMPIVRRIVGLLVEQPAPAGRHHDGR